MRSMHVLHDAVCGVSGDQKRASDHWNWSIQARPKFEVDEQASRLPGRRA